MVAVSLKKFFQAEDGIRDIRPSRGLGDVYKRQDQNFMTSCDGVFVAGDAKRGASLVVWAIWEGREAARCIDLYLMGESNLPSSPQAEMLA